MPHLPFILFLFVFGACVGSFLNVLVWRMPRWGWASLVTPPSHCPRCEHHLAWYDNIPVFGWIFLRGRCRYCREPISARYPLVEFTAGGIFAIYYILFFIYHIGPVAPQFLRTTSALFGTTFTNQFPTTLAAEWPVYLLYMVMFSCLLAVSLIDFDLYIIPSEIPWFLAAFGLLIHAIIDRPSLPGALNLDPQSIAAPLAAGGGVGLLISIILFLIGHIPQSFADGEPVEEIDEEQYQAELAAAEKEHLPPPPPPRKYTVPEIRVEIRKEISFLLLPLALALLSAALAFYLPAVAAFWQQALQYHWLSGLLGSLLGAMVGGLIVWAARIFGTLAFSRVAMGLGDVHLMFGVGAIIGALPALLAFFVAPFAGLAIGLYALITRNRRAMPYGPYLSLATALAVLMYCPVADYLRPGMQGLSLMLRSLLRPG